MKRLALLVLAVGVVGCGGELPQSEDGDLRAGEVVGGKPTTIEAHPYQVSLQFEQDGAGRHFCGGTIVGSEWVLTAQHCVESMPASILRVVAGATDIREVVKNSIAGADTGTAQVRSVQDVHQFGSYFAAWAGGDMALLRVDRPFEFTPSVSAARLPSANDMAELEPGAEVIATGWGVTNLDYEAPEVLQKLRLILLDDDFARTAIQKAVGGSPNMQHHLGAGLIGVPNRSTCFGDSGGPLVAETEEGPVVLGATSFGTSSCASPDNVNVFAKVGTFVPWINAVQGVDSTIVLRETVGDVAFGETKIVSFELPNLPDGASLSVAITGGGDADLLVGQGPSPVDHAVACHPNKGGSNERCEILDPQAGTWFAAIRGYRDAQRVRLSVVTRQNNQPEFCGNGRCEESTESCPLDCPRAYQEVPHQTLLAYEVSELDLSWSAGTVKQQPIPVMPNTRSIVLEIDASDELMGRMAGSLEAINNYDEIWPCFLRGAGRQRCQVVNPTAGTWYLALEPWNDSAHVRSARVWIEYDGELCGDQVCVDSYESCGSCPQDCGLCAFEPQTIVRDDLSSLHDWAVVGDVSLQEGEPVRLKQSATMSRDFGFGTFSVVYLELAATPVDLQGNDAVVVKVSNELGQSFVARRFSRDDNLKLPTSGTYRIDLSQLSGGTTLNVEIESAVSGAQTAFFLDSIVIKGVR